VNGFLVVVRCGSDDIPIRLCESRDEAQRVAGGLRRADVLEAETTLSIDVSVYHNVSVYTFQGGRLTDAVCVRDFDDEPDCEFSS
jgi:hypothetical protein